MSRPAYPASASQESFRRFAAAALLAAFAFAAASQAWAQTPPPPNSTPITQLTRRIVVSIPDRKLALLEDDRVLKVYDVAVGAPASPSPDGEYQIAQRLENPTYYHPGVVIGPGADNPLGARWIGLNVKGFGIHGTNRPESVGKNASHGCIRLRDRDIQDLFARVKIGDRVSLMAQRNDEIARLFGNGPAPTGPAQTIAAKNDTPATAEPELRGER